MQTPASAAACSQTYPAEALLSCGPARCLSGLGIWPLTSLDVRVPAWRTPLLPRRPRATTAGFLVCYPDPWRQGLPP